MLITPATVGGALGLPPDAWRLIDQEWSESLAAWDGAFPDFMRAEVAAEALRGTGYPTALDEEFRQVEQITRKQPLAQFYAWHWQRTALRSDHHLPGTVPEPFGLYGKLAGVFHLMIALSAVPLIRAGYAAIGVPESYARDTAQWLAGTIGIYQAAHQGMVGHQLEQTSWLRFSIKGELFRLGRLEFLVHRAPDWMPAVYRHCKNGRLIALAGDGWWLNPAGRRVAPATPGAVAARLRQHPERVSGIPVHPDGYALVGREVSLELTEWAPAVSAYDWVPSVHIPGGGGMTPTAVMDSLTQARDFFRTYFDKELVLTVCYSWIFNPQLAEALPDSNLAAFQRETYRFPVLSGEADGLFFVFGRRLVDWELQPCRTRLERTLRDWQLTGVPLASGGMVFAFDDLSHWGSEHYRNTTL